MSTITQKVTQKQAEAVLQEVAVWLGRKGLAEVTCKEGRELNYVESHVDDGTPCDQTQVGPAPTGRDAAYRGLGPELRMDFEPYWSNETYPAIILEGGPYDWSIACSFEVQQALDAKGVKVFVEPATGWALGIFPA
jgi:hypothetical protein